jgi:hypothetical protein
VSVVRTQRVNRYRSYLGAMPHVDPRRATIGCASADPQYSAVNATHPTARTEAMVRQPRLTGSTSSMAAAVRTSTVCA